MATTGKQPTAPLLDVARQLANRLGSLHSKVLDIEGKLDPRGAGSDEAKSSVEPVCSLTGYLEESHEVADSLDSAVDRILEKLGD